MDKQMKLKRVEILNKIQLLINNCECSEGNKIKGCLNCKELAELGSQLNKLVRKRKKNTLKNHNYPNDRSERIEWTDEMIQHLKDNAHDYTCKEMAEHLEIDVKQVYNRCLMLGIKFKRDVSIYKYYVNDQLIITGTIPEISKHVGLGKTTLHQYHKHNKAPHGRKIVKIEG